MTAIVLSDSHGKDVWKEIVNANPKADKIVFLGDYFDSFDIPYAKQEANFLDICTFKRDNMDKVVLLRGNHDHHYLINAKYSGYQEEYAPLIRRMLIDAQDILKVAYQWEDILFIHAGLTKSWMKGRRVGKDIIKGLERIFKNDMNAFGFTPCPKKKFSQYTNPYGDEVCQSPFWVRPDSLLKDKYPLRQVVGHTAMERIKIEDGIAFTDCLDFKREYLSIVDGEFVINGF